MSGEILMIEAVTKVAATYGADLTLTAVSKSATPAVSYTGTDPVDGDIVVFSVSTGMVELDGMAVRITGVNGVGDTFTIEGVDTTNFDTFTAGTAKKVATWDTAGDAVSIEFSDTEPDKIDTTRLADLRKKYVWGRENSSDVTLKCILVPDSDALATVKTQERARGNIAVLLTTRSGEQIVFNGTPTVSPPVTENNLLMHNWRFSLQAPELVYPA